MNKILVILSLFAMSCSSNGGKVDTANGSEHEQHDTAPDKAATALQLNNGAKWKTDEATRKNVAAMVIVINDTSNIGMERRAQLTKQLQTRIDIMVKQCKMKGPDHDALHLWLEQVLSDLQEVKEEKNEYQTSYSALKQDVESFYAFFE